MRYSLLTLVVVTVWVALAMLVWQRWEPWAFDPRPRSREEIAREYPAFTLDSARPDRNVAPDGRTFNSESSGDSNIYIALDVGHRVRLYDLIQLPYFVLDFIDNDTILARNTDETRPYRIFHRRHPEWWWGHFYRVEVWVLVGLTIGIGVRGLRGRKLVA